MNSNIFFKVGNNQWEHDPWFCDTIEHKDGGLYFDKDLMRPYVYWDGKWNKIGYADLSLKDLDAMKFISVTKEETCQNYTLDIDITDLV